MMQMGVLNTHRLNGGGGEYSSETMGICGREGNEQEGARGWLRALPGGPLGILTTGGSFWCEGGRPHLSISNAPPSKTVVHCHGSAGDGHHSTKPSALDTFVSDFHVPRRATSVRQPRHDQMEQGPTEPHAGRSTFLLSSGGAGGGYY